jgi:uncharacterized membrane protein
MSTYLRLIPPALAWLALPLLLVAPASEALAQVKVTSATPSSAYQGARSLDVVVSGSGFDASARVQYFVSGTTLSGGITVRSVTYRKSSELVTTIDVAEGAVLANFDIQVTLDSGRKGKGTTLFKVQSKPADIDSRIQPQDLGSSVNCRGSYGLGINDGLGGVPLQVAGQGTYCTESTSRPVLWTAGTGMQDLGTIDGARGGGAVAVSDDGTVVGILSDGASLGFVRPLGGPMEALPGLVPLKALDIGANGAYIVATDGNDVGARWDRSSGTWRPTLLPSGTAVAVSDAGAVVGHVPVVGAVNVFKARVWTPSGSVVLPGEDTRANDIDARGSAIAGFRRVEVACKRRPCAKYSVPMVWTLDDGAWVAHQLAGINDQDCVATAVAEVNGDVVVVGYGRDPYYRALYWKRDRESQEFGPPVLLGGLGSGSADLGTMAEGINASGQIVGWSTVEISAQESRPYAVIWQLP